MYKTTKIEVVQQMRDAAKAVTELQKEGDYRAADRYWQKLFTLGYERLGCPVEKLANLQL